MLKTGLLIGAAAAALGAASVANATTWQAFVEENYSGNVASAAAFEAGEGSEIYIGDVSSLNFDSSRSANGYTIGGFLASGGFNYTGQGAGDTLDNTLWLFYTDQTFSSAPTLTVTHDDGIEAVYNNINGPAYVGFTAGGTAAVAETGTCPSCVGSGMVGIIYNEAFGPPGVLIVDSIPEPTTWGLMLLGFGGLGVMARRSRKATSAA